jgi:hypothetical protein
MAKLKRHSTDKHSEQVRTRPRITTEEDAPFASPVHVLHERLNQRVFASPNVHSTPVARILYFIVIPATLWAMIIQTARIL